MSEETGVQLPCVASYAERCRDLESDRDHATRKDDNGDQPSGEDTVWQRTTQQRQSWRAPMVTMMMIGLNAFTTEKRGIKYDIRMNTTSTDLQQMTI